MSLAVERLREIVTEGLARADEPTEAVVDMHYFTVAFNSDRVRSRADEVRSLLAEWPTEAWGAVVPALSAGPSYIHVGGVLGDQGDALRFMAWGQVADLWRVVTPERLGFTGPDADQMAGIGFVLIDPASVRVNVPLPD